CPPGRRAMPPTRPQRSRPRATTRPTSRLVRIARNPSATRFATINVTEPKTPPGAASVQETHSNHADHQSVAYASDRPECARLGLLHRGDPEGQPQQVRVQQGRGRDQARP